MILPVTRTKTRIIRACGITLSLYSSCVISDATSDIVKGFANFQATRVENIILDSFVDDLANQKFLKQFFPDTSTSTKGFNGISGKRLLPLLEFYVRADLEYLKQLTRCVEQKTSNLKSLKIEQLKNSDTRQDVINNIIKPAFETLDNLLTFKQESKFTTKDFLIENKCPDIDKTLTGSESWQVRKPDAQKVDKFSVEILNKIRNSDFNVDVIDKIKQLKTIIKRLNSDQALNSLNAQFHEFQAQINAFQNHPGYADIVQSAQKVKDIITTLNANGADSTTSARMQNDELKEAFNQFIEQADTLLERLEGPEKNAFNHTIQIALDELAQSSGKDFWLFTLDNNSDLLTNVDLSSLFRAIDTINRIRSNIDIKPATDLGGSQRSKTYYAIYVHQLVLALKAMGFDVEQREYFQTFKSAALFLATLADVTSSDNGGPKAVTNVIRDFIDEDSVYNNKRDSIALYTRRKNAKNLRCTYLFNCRNTWFIGSYYGFSVSRPFRNDYDYRAFGPVGVEFKLYSGYSYTVTMMTAPLDIGIYITDELNEDEYDVDIDDIRAPSYFFSISSRKSPLSFQIGYQTNVPSGINQKDEYYFMAVSFDLPLYTLR